MATSSSSNGDSIHPCIRFPHVKESTLNRVKKRLHNDKSLMLAYELGYVIQASCLQCVQYMIECTEVDLLQGSVNHPEWDSMEWLHFTEQQGCLTDDVKVYVTTKYNMASSEGSTPATNMIEAIGSDNKNKSTEPEAADQDEVDEQMDDEWSDSDDADMEAYTSQLDTTMLSLYDNQTMVSLLSYRIQKDIYNQLVMEFHRHVTENPECDPGQAAVIAMHERLSGFTKKLRDLLEVNLEMPLVEAAIRSVLQWCETSRPGTLAGIPYPCRPTSTVVN